MRLSVLDSLRGIFALMIVFLHTAMQSNLFYTDFVRNSFIFVEFFFVLSGFVISLSQMDKIHRPYALPEFMIRRVGRLWPLHMAVLGGFVALLLTRVLADALGIFSADLPYTGPQITGFIIENVFLVQAFRNETVMWLNFPSWSISAELWAYAVFGVVCLAPLRLIPWLAALVGLGAFAVLCGWIDPGFGAFFNYGLFQAICFFMLGHLCYLVWLRIRHLRLPAASAAETAVVVLIVLQTVYLDNPVVTLLMPLTFALAILVFTFEAGAVSRLLSLRPFRMLGERSYSIYMIHILVFSIIGLLVRVAERLTGVDLQSPNLTDAAAQPLLDFGPFWVMDMAMLLQACLVVWLAGFTYRFIEIPGQNWTSRYIAAWRARRVPVQAGASPPQRRK